MRLTAEEEEMSGGKQGEAVRRALQLQVTVGDFFQADRFVPVTSVHMMAKIESMGEPGLDWIESMAAA